jgi:hypothetical protein
MPDRSKFDSLVESLGVAGFIACLTGAIATMSVVFVRLPALATSKVELLFGTLLVTAVSLLFGIAGLLVILLLMVRRGTRPRTDP